MKIFIKTLDKLKKSEPSEQECKYDKGWNDAIEKVEKLFCPSGLSDAWIPVEIGLPKESDCDNSGYVMVTIKDTNFEEPMVYCGEDRLENGEWLNYNDENVKVIAWQPFPTAYKEKEHE